ncbi:MAG: hypothetical protein ABSA58_24915 [Acetobacteraceae bacterium]|jgi:hypothetical protein
MALNIETKSKRGWPKAFAAAVMATVVFGGVTAASAAPDRDRDRRGDHHDRDWHPHGWSGGYYAPPPVVYGRPYYAPPPVVYGPGIGLNIRIP